MLILKRKPGEFIQLGGVRITVQQAGGARVRLHVVAPDDIPVIHHQLLMGALEISEDEIQHERDWSNVIPI